jgi:GDP-L-fucose synthase
MKIAILGARGTVGGYLFRTLQDKYTVTGITRDDMDFRDASSVHNFFKNNSFDIVINAAINPHSSVDAPMSVAQDNFAMFTNLYAVKDMFGKCIHFASGAEFDQTKPIVNVREEDLFNIMPSDPYGMSKNVTTRIANCTENWYTLRLFGVFHPSELPRRLLPKLKTNQDVKLIDKYFDYLYLEDLLPVVENYINEVPKYKDMNLVYPEKMLLSTFVKKFCQLHNLSGDNITYGDFSELSYTADSSKFTDLNLPQQGINTGLAKYK